MELDVRVFPGLEELSGAVAGEIALLANASADAGKQFSVALSGGSTPKHLHEMLANDYRDRLPWQQVHLFWGDERYVPHDDPQSNFRMARETLLNRVPIPLQNINPMPTHFLRSENAARAYEGILRNYFSDGMPAFDVLLLGMGTDGHTASLFPAAAELKEETRWVVPVEAPPQVVPHLRLSLTLNAINSARNVFFLVAGSDKRTILHSIFHETEKAKTRYPAAMVVPLGRLVWFVDNAAMPA